MTLVANVVNPRQYCSNDSNSVVVPHKYSAYATSGLINSTLSRYYSFLLLRSGILLRRRAHWYPRTVDHLPIPDLGKKGLARLHHLAREATEISRGVTMNPLETYEKEMAACPKTIKAGYLKVTCQGQASTFDADDLAEGEVKDDRIRLEGLDIVCADADVPWLTKMALLATQQEEFSTEDVENVLLPDDAAERSRVASAVRDFADTMKAKQARMEAIIAEIDEIVAEGMGLTPADLDTVRQRCQEFPLSVTVAQPRYVWSAGRKRQARREYDEDERFA